ncbi:hypothetical protein AMELA_G00133860 [Ameiurus melas]|uniref:GRAM domain-containing protein n=1 Tax=Ameiurus melas TaxID=219545 RepID=A0A7J6AJP1_AMEME|nr:hypothetical protein AMELA_G00133860 [Ameiurus melas]
MSDQAEDVSLLTPQDVSEPPKEDDTHHAPHFRVHLFDELSCEDVKKCTRGLCEAGSTSVVKSSHASASLQAFSAKSSRPLREKSRLQGSCVHELISLPPASSSSHTVSKYNSQYHKLFHNVPKEENLMKVYSCALLRDILLQGRLYISRNWLCFYANLFGKDIKVCIPVVSVRLVKKHKTAGLVPNGLAITTDSSQKYVFVSLLSRDSVYDVLRQICTHLQVNGKKSLSFKQYMEQPTSLSLKNSSREYQVAMKPGAEVAEESAVASRSSAPRLIY